MCLQVRGVPRVKLQQALRKLGRLKAMSNSATADQVHDKHALSVADEKVCWWILSKAFDEVSNWQDGGHAIGRPDPGRKTKRLLLSSPGSLIRIILTGSSSSIVIT